MSKKPAKHHPPPHPLYGTWIDMRRRCTDPRVKAYPRYGGRGIGVCPQWMSDFWTFLADVGERPSKGHTLDRIDNDGDYGPGNVRWATARQQANNTSTTHLLEHNGKRLSITEWGQTIGVQQTTMSKRVLAFGLERALQMGGSKYRPPAPLTGDASKAVVRKAIKRGLIRRQPCEICGESNSVSTKVSSLRDEPLRLRWLCRPHFYEQVLRPAGVLVGRPAHTSTGDTCERRSL